MVGRIIKKSIDDISIRSMRLCLDCVSIPKFLCQKHEVRGMGGVCFSSVHLYEENTTSRGLFFKEIHGLAI